MKQQTREKDTKSLCRIEIVELVFFSFRQQEKQKNFQTVKERPADYSTQYE